MYTLHTTLIFADSYGQNTYGSCTYQAASCSTTATSTGTSGTATSTGGTLADTGILLIAIMTAACMLICAALIIRFWRRPARETIPIGPETPPASTPEA